ncbi:MAG: hypothetical protein K5979_12060 [Ruminococcus sp.]|nr:hypothetical protein [Ruminococcus sp.]
MNNKFFTYKGYPLVRSGKQMYYGYMCDPYVIYIQILETKKYENEDFISKARIVLMNTNENAPKKNAVFDCGIYEALDTAKVWLDKALMN